jgi:pyridinium-3,5-biscarboxylic acid mononucleotide synthase
LYNTGTLDEGRLRQLLGAVATGELSPEDAMARLAAWPFEDLGYARVDHHRALRGGPEVVYGAGKTPEEAAGIVAALLAQDAAPVLVTRATAGHAEAVREVAPAARWHARSGMLVCRAVEPDPARTGLVGVVCAGTSDLPVAEEAWVTAEAFGCRVDTLVDVGVAGAHRLFAEAGRLQAADVLVVVAGMEGALPSLVAGMVAAPVVAVPTSVGYGAAFEGLAALLGMLNSCAVGVSVVNIDNGFGAGVLAARILRARRRPESPAGRGDGGRG